jgi:hypothetical protein
MVTVVFLSVFAALLYWQWVRLAGVRERFGDVGNDSLADAHPVDDWDLPASVPREQETRQGDS